MKSIIAVLVLLAAPVSAYATDKTLTSAERIDANMRAGMKACFYGGMMVQERLTNGTYKDPKIRASMANMAKVCGADDDSVFSGWNTK